MNSRRGYQLVRRLRWTLLALLLLLLWFFVLSRYVYQRVHNESAAAMQGAMHVGERHLLDTEPAHELLRDWIVGFLGSEGGLYWSRVRGVPGDRLERAEGRWTLVGPEGERHRLDPSVDFDAALAGQELAEDEYLLLNDRLEAPWPDSRFLGPIPRERIRFRMVFHFGQGNG